jgi:hypothetical protein
MEISFTSLQKYSLQSCAKFYNVIAHFLPNNLEDHLHKNNIILPLEQFTRNLMINYINFYSCITPVWIIDMTHFSIRTGIEKCNKKKNYTRKEIYKLILKKCKNVKYLSNYPYASSFFQICWT